MKKQTSFSGYCKTAIVLSLILSLFIAICLALVFFLPYEKETSFRFWIHNGSPTDF